MRNQKQTPLNSFLSCHSSGKGAGGERSFPPSLDISVLTRHSCSRGFLTIQCLRCGHRRVIRGGSRDRTCPACQKAIYEQIFQRYKAMLKGISNLKFLTLTWKPTKRQDPIIVRDLGRAFNRFLHRQPYSKVWKGLLATVECKKTPQNEFYYHIHCILDGVFIPQARISRDWRECSGFPIVYVKKISKTRNRALRYLLKYVLKGFSFEDPKDKADFKVSFKGVRFIRSYGQFYNSNYNEAEHSYFPCPNCGAVKSWVVLDFLNVVDLFEGVPYYPA